MIATRMGALTTVPRRKRGARGRRPASANCSCARARPRLHEHAPRRVIAEQPIEGGCPLFRLPLRPQDAGVGDDVGDLAAAAGDDRHAARHGLYQHAAKLLAPARASSRSAHTARPLRTDAPAPRHARRRSAREPGRGAPLRSAEVRGHRPAADEERPPRAAQAFRAPASACAGPSPARIGRDSRRPARFRPSRDAGARPRRAAESGRKRTTSTPGEITRDGLAEYSGRGACASCTVLPNAIHPAARFITWRSKRLKGGG